MGIKEKDFLDIAEQLIATIASVAVTAEIIVKAIKESKKSKQEGRRPDEDDQ